jgi:hypothetical protein
MADEKKHYRMNLGTGYYRVTVKPIARWEWLQRWWRGNQLRLVKIVKGYMQRAGKRQRDAGDEHARIVTHARKEIREGRSEPEAIRNTAKLLGYSVRHVRRTWRKYS